MHTAQKQPQPTTAGDAMILLPGTDNGYTVIPPCPGSKRLNYFDGQFLTAKELKIEQDYLRQRTRCANQAAGWGVVHGLSCSLTGDGLIRITKGLAIDIEGNCLKLSADIEVGLDALIEASNKPTEFVHKPAFGGVPGRSADFNDCTPQVTPPPGPTLTSRNLFIITVNFAEALCGQAEVFGNPCEQACENQRQYAYIVDGVVIRAVPLTDALQLKSFAGEADIHLRSQIASALFAVEQERIGSLISRQGLESLCWCLGAQSSTRDGVPLALVSNGSTQFLDAWTVRRERIELPPRHYWAYRMMMRPWRVFLAQVLQFQCQLRDILTSGRLMPGPFAPGKTGYTHVTGAIHGIEEVYQSLVQVCDELAGMDSLEVPVKHSQEKLQYTKQSLEMATAAFHRGQSDRMLIDSGIVELPAAGYLPVTPSQSVLVNEQIERLMGPGVDLRFCIVRPDYVAHALEESQHMERICLLSGIGRKSQREAVDILVPEGELIDVGGRGISFRMVGSASRQLNGAARLELDAHHGGCFYLASRESEENQAMPKAPDDKDGGDSAGFGGTGPNEIPVAPKSAAKHPKETAADGEDTSSGAEAKSGFVTTVGTTRGVRLADLWINLCWQHDPFRLPIGGSTFVNFEYSQTYQFGIEKSEISFSAVRGANAVQLYGQLTRQPSAANDECTLSALFSGTMQSVLPGSTRSTQKPIQFPVELKRSSCCGKWPNSLTISLPQATPGFDEVIVQWSKDPMLIDVCLNGQRPGSGGIRKAASSADTPSELNRVCVAGALLNEDDTVLNPHVRYHNEAMSALHAIGKAFGDAAYARSRQPLLFPQTRLETGNLIRATHDWVLFRRRRASSCDCLGTCTPIKPASTLTHICAVSWNHCGREDRLIPVHKPDGSIHAAPSLVVGFDSPIHLVDPDGCCVFTVSISFKRPLENIPEDLNHLQQFALMLQSNACFCLDGTVVPVKYEKAPKQPHRITRATVTTYPADGLAFIINDDTILKDILRSGIEFKVRVQCDFILNERKEPVDGEFLRAQFPTGDSQPGGIFESCFRLGHFKHEFGGDSVTDGTGDDIIPEGTGLDTEIPEDGSGTVINTDDPVTVDTTDGAVTPADAVGTPESGSGTVVGTDDPVTVDTTDGAVTPADPVGTPESGSGTVLDTDDPVTVDTTNGTVTPVDPVGTPESAGSTVVDTDDPVTVDTTDDSVTPVDSGGSTVVEPGTGATDDGEPEVDVGEVTMNVFLVPETLTSVQMLQQRATDIGGGAFLEFTDASNKLSVVTFPATAASHAESLERTRLKFQSSADPGLQLAAISVVAKTADAGAQGRIHKQTDLIRKTLQPSGPKTIVVKSHEVKLNKPVTILFPFKGTVS